MLAAHFGKLINQARLSKGWTQHELAIEAGVARAIVSRLEQGQPRPVQSDTLDRLFAALEVSPQISRVDAGTPRRLARLEHELRLRDQREKHLRLAIELASNESAAAPKVAKARQRVELWRSNRTCSPLYIERWSRLLALAPCELAQAMASLEEWEDAMFQNSPWSWAWT